MKRRRRTRRRSSSSSKKLFFFSSNDHCCEQYHSSRLNSCKILLKFLGDRLSGGWWGSFRLYRSHIRICLLRLTLSLLSMSNDAFHHWFCCGGVIHLDRVFLVCDVGQPERIKNYRSIDRIRIYGRDRPRRDPFLLISTPAENSHVRVSIVLLHCHAMQGISVTMICVQRAKPKITQVHNIALVSIVPQ